MRAELSEEEEQFVSELVTWDRTRRNVELVFYTLLLVIGGAVIVIAGYITIQHLTDRTALSVTVPGFLLGLLLIGLYLFGERRVKERRMAASVLKKLRGEG